MEELKLSDWIHPNIQPKIAGWYERQWSHMSSRRDCMDYWDGHFWRHGDGSYSYDAKWIGNDSLFWRGLAENP